MGTFHDPSQNKCIKLSPNTRPVHFITMLQRLHWFSKYNLLVVTVVSGHPGWGSTSTFNAVVFPFCIIMFWPDKSFGSGFLSILAFPPLFLGQTANHQNSRALGNGSSHGPSIENLTLRQTGGETGHSTWPKWKAKAGWITNDGAVCFGMFFWVDGSFSLVSPYISPHTVMNDKHYECLKSLGYIVYMMKWSCTNWPWNQSGKSRAQGNKERIQKTAIFIILI